jgi:hypothetical protein
MVPLTRIDLLAFVIHDRGNDKLHHLHIVDMAPTAIRERRRTLRYRNLLVRQMVQLKNKIAVLLMEAGVSVIN